jgi:hypothetical protein
LLGKKQEERLWMKAWYEEEKNESRVRMRRGTVFEALARRRQVHSFEGSTNRFSSTYVLIWELA